MPRGSAASAVEERYDLSRSPLAQKPTQRDIATLVGETRDDLRRMVDYKEEFIVRSETKPDRKGKVRQLAYPVSRLRRIHERLKFHLLKVRQPSYLFSPRKGRGQRDNASEHLDRQQYLTLDLKKFYPSTTRAMVKRWMINDLDMAEDVAGIVAHLASVDDVVSFGSPLTPVLCSLVHRPMFDRIAQLCDVRGLAYTVWVDDLTISGRFVPGELLEQVRSTIRQAGLRSHDIVYRTGNRPVFITGIGVLGPDLVAPNYMNLRVRDAFREYHEAVTPDEKDEVCQRLLTYLGGMRHIYGTKSARGQKAASQINTLRQERDVRQARTYAAVIAESRATAVSTGVVVSLPPWE